MKLLLVDDDQVSRAALRELMGNASGWEVVEVGDGQRALDLLCDRFRPDLLIIDLNLPGLKGLELLQRIRRDPELKGLKVVVTSGTRDRETIVSLAKLQVSAYLLKPYDPERTRTLLKPFLPASANPILASRNLLKRTLLAVDDDAVARVMIKGFVPDNSGWEVVCAEDGQDALDRLHAGLRPDLILTDLLMPRLDGIGLITRVREDVSLQKLRIAVISNDQDREKVKVLGQRQIFGYLLKPLDASKVQALLDRVAKE